MKGFILLGLLFSSLLSHAFTTVSLDSNGYVSKDEITFSKKNLTKSSDRTDSFTGVSPIKSTKRVFGDYLRDRVYDSSSSDQRVIGQIDRICSGTLVSSRHIITAAHCVYSVQNGSWIDRNSFSAGRLDENDSPYGTVDWKKVYILEEWINTGETEYDFAIIELKEALGDRIGWKSFGYNNNIEDGTTGRINGYPGDKPSGTAWKVECPMTFYEKEITHRCDTYGGMSGSSIRFTDSDGDDVIYGIHTYGGSNYNGGSRINPEVFQVLKSWLDNSRSSGDTVRTNSTPTQDFDKIYFKNNCYKTIWTALHYVDTDGEWKTEGWWKVQPNEKAYVADTRNRIYYIHAQSEDGQNSWSGDYNFNIRGDVKGFKKKEITTDEWGKWTQSFSCNN